MATINDKNLKNAIANVIVNNYMNQKVDFGSDEFVVENFKIKFRKAAIRKGKESPSGPFLRSSFIIYRPDQKKGHNRK